MGKRGKREREEGKTTTEGTEGTESREGAWRGPADEVLVEGAWPFESRNAASADVRPQDSRQVANEPRRQCSTLQPI